MKKLSRGILVTVEGIDGCGKSTFVHNLAPLLQEFPIVCTQEPGATALGNGLRALVKQQETPLAPKAEFLLYATDRAQHFHEIVEPALAQKKLIISDRMADSSVVYQGYARGLDITIINAVNHWIMDPVTPDLTFFIDIPIELAAQRTHKRPVPSSTVKQEQRSFWIIDPATTDLRKKVLHGYQEIFKNRTNVVTIDGTKKPEILAQKAAQYINQWLEKQKLYE